MPEYLKNMLIGIFVIVAMGLIVLMVLFIKPTVGDGKQILHVRFSNINGISVGTRVIFAGKAIGEVESINVLPDARQHSADANGNLYYYVLTLRVDSQIQIYSTDTFTVQTSGLLGDKSVAIIPRAPEKGQPQLLVNSQSIIFAKSDDLLESAYHILNNLGTKVSDAFTSFNNWIQSYGDDLGHAITAFDQTMTTSTSFIQSLQDQKIVDDVKIAAQSFNRTMESVDQAIQTLEETDAFNNTSCLISSLTETSDKIRDAVDSITEGQGTLAKLIHDDETYLQITAVLSKFNTMMNDINQYGLLFNMNKQWKRDRTKKAALIESLHTPQQFKSYFEGEVDEINTAMGRLSLMMDKASKSPQKEKILNDPLFKAEFKNLMQQVEALKDSLKIYNQHLIDLSGVNP
jgi:phospholipid/cholesterol/gamma-HCH transport system substrate-binding protein